MIRFRPLPVMTGAMAPALALLIVLGFWQLDAASEKTAAIAVFKELTARAPISLTEALCGGEPVVGGQVIAPTRIEPGALKFYGQHHNGLRGWRVLQAGRLPECASAYGQGIAIETGFEPLRGRAPNAPSAYTLQNPPSHGAFTPDNTDGATEFYRWDRDAVATGLGFARAENLAPFWLVERSGSLPPKLAKLPPSRHYGYAATWFGFALVLIAIYFAYHRKIGRLGS